MRQAGGFGHPEQWRSDWERRYGRDEWLDQVPTFGGYSQLPAAVQTELLAGIARRHRPDRRQLHHGLRHGGGYRDADLTR